MDAIKKSRPYQIQKQSGDWNDFNWKVLDIRSLSNAMIVNKDRAKIPPKLIIPWDFLQNLSGSTHLNVQNNGMP